jgi:hypothetical protein
VGKLVCLCGFINVETENSLGIYTSGKVETVLDPTLFQTFVSIVLVDFNCLSVCSHRDSEIWLSYGTADCCVNCISTLVGLLLDQNLWLSNSQSIFVIHLRPLLCRKFCCLNKKFCVEIMIPSFHYASVLMVSLRGSINV